MHTNAAIMRSLHDPLSIEAIELDPPREGEILIRMVATGICGSDRHVREGTYPSAIPAVCGHEGAGVVEQVGPGVSGIAIGDHVIHTFVGPCGICETCRRGQRTFCPVRGNPDGSMRDGTFRMHDRHGIDVATTLGLGSFSRHTVSPVTNCVRLPPDVDLQAAALISCGVSTGVGSVINVARLEVGESVAIVGFGGVGAAAALGSVLGGASRIVAVDVHASKAAVATALGATDFVDATTSDVLTEIRRITEGRGVDKVLLTVDRVRPEHYQLALECLAPGGVAVQVGTSTSGLDHVPVDPSLFIHKQVSLTGTVYGGMDPERDALRYADLVRAGRLPVQHLITRTYGLDQINEAFDDLAAGRNIRGVILFDA